MKKKAIQTVEMKETEEYIVGNAVIFIQCVACSTLYSYTSYASQCSFQYKNNCFSFTQKKKIVLFKHSSSRAISTNET